LTLRFDLEYYALPEMKEIVETMAGKMKILLSPQAAKELAKVLGGLPRQAKHLLNTLRLHYSDSETRHFSLQDVRGFLEDLGIEDTGLRPLEQRYLRELARFGTASLGTLALALGSDPDDL